MIFLKLKILEENEDQIKFIIENSFPEFANALRRVITTHIPVLAVGYINIEENSSGLYDEVLAHRIGLVPLKYNPDDYVEKDKCSCKGKGCSNCEVVLVLDKTGPCTVYSGDFKSTDKNVKPVFDSIQIVDLIDGQKLKLEAIAYLGKASEHAKYQAAIVGYEADEKEKNFTFVVETTSGLKPRQILDSALGILEEKTNELISELEKNVK